MKIERAGGIAFNIPLISAYILPSKYILSRIKIKPSE